MTQVRFLPRVVQGETREKRVATEGAALGFSEIYFNFPAPRLVCIRRTIARARKECQRLKQHVVNPSRTFRTDAPDGDCSGAGARRRKRPTAPLALFLVRTAAVVQVVR